MVRRCRIGQQTYIGLQSSLRRSLVAPQSAERVTFFRIYLFGFTVIWDLSEHTQCVAHRILTSSIIMNKIVTRIADDGLEKFTRNGLKGTYFRLLFDAQTRKPRLNL